ncbi:MAG: hypothetical protein ACE5H7_17805 [Acidiferrobacterales bacterium]
MSIVIAIITIAASGVLAAVVAYRLNATKEHVFFMRQKAEALYLAIERYDRTLGSHFVPYYSVIKNEITYNELLDLQIKDRGSAGSDSASALDAAIMLINVYFPNLKPHLDRYTTARECINKILADHKRAYKQGDTDGAPWFNPFHEAVQELDRVAAEFKQAVIAEAGKLAPAERLWPRSLTLPAVRARIERILRNRKA